MSWQDEWKTSEGLLSDVDVTVEKAYFCVDSKYNNGETVLLKWDVRTDDGEEHTLQFNLSKGFVISDGGAACKHDSGERDRYPAKNSGYGMLMERAAGKVAEYNLRDQGLDKVFEQRKADWRKAETWVGLRFHVIREEFDFGEDRNNPGKRMKAGRTLPTTFLGVAGAEEKKKPSKAAAAKPEAKKAEEQAPETAAASGGGSLVSTLGLDKVFAAKLKAAAKKSGSAEAFENAAVDIDGVVDNEPLLASVMDGSLYAELTA